MKISNLIHILLTLSVFLLSAPSVSATETVDFEIFANGTMLYSQVPGVLFLGKPMVETYGAAASGTKVLHTYRPGQEFHSGPLTITFTTPQDYVALKAGLIRPSSFPINASLKAYNAMGVQLVTDTGVIPVGPNSISQEFEVTTSSPQISRIELQYNGSLFEAIDDLVISNQGPPAPADTVAPQITIIDPLDGEIVTTEDFYFQAGIVEENLNFAELTIEHAGNSNTFRVSYLGFAPNLQVGPFWTGDLGVGPNTVTLTAVDLSGNSTSASVTVVRAAVEAQLVIDTVDPWVIPRTPGVPEPLRVEVAETFPGSLDGSNGITVEAVAPSMVYGTTTIQNPWDPNAFANLDLRANHQSPLGSTTVTLQAVDTTTGVVLDTATLRASLVPSNPVSCDGSNITYYQLVDRVELEDELNATVDLKLTGLGVTVQDGGGIDPTIPTDSDVGLTLTNFTSREAFVDLNNDGTYSIFEPVYADTDGSGTVNSPDQRLKHAPIGAHGSFEVTGDVDDGDLLTPFSTSERYVDLNDNSLLDAALEEPIYFDTTGDGVVSHNDLRMADPLVAPPLVKKTDMTVAYRDYAFSSDGLLRVSQEFWAVDGDSQADVDYIADLQISVAPNNITFSHNYLHIAITGWFLGVPVGDWHWTVQDAEDDFKNDFANVLRDELGPNLLLRINEMQGGAGAFLADGYFTDTEFGLGFCLLPAVFPGTDDIGSDQ